MRRDLVVTEDLPASAVAVFLALAPRTVALTGGTTLVAVHERLAAIPYTWNSVDVFFGDERCVPREHPDSNVGMGYRTLLDRVPARGHPIDGEACDAEAYERDLRETLGERPAIDLVFLGLGPDGHVASLYPGHPTLEERSRWVVHVPEPGLPPPHPRITMTLPVLSAARAVAFLVEGAEKRQALADLMAGNDIPASRVEAQRVVILADPDAAGGLSSR
ncbi:MAG TPA: 6-phosphogluconolactonase [Actinomycetota bacterium]